MKRILGFVIILCMVSPAVQAADIPLADIYNPRYADIYQEKLYVVQEESVFIYSLKDFKLLNTFGEAGEGPRQFRKIPLPWIPSINTYFSNSSILVNSLGKVSFFDLQGQFIREKKLNILGQFGRLIPAGENRYFMIKFQQNDEKQRVTAAYLLNEQYEIVRKLDEVLFPEQNGEKRNPIQMAKMAQYFDRYSSRGRLVLPLDDGRVRIYDQSGKQMASFTPPYTRVKMDREREKMLDRFFSNSIHYKRPYLQDKSRGLVTFGEHLPLFNLYRVTMNKIYLFGHHKRDGKYETFVYDFSGQLLKKIFLPIRDKDPFDVYPFAIYRDMVYQLYYDEEDEQTCLHVYDIQ